MSSDSTSPAQVPVPGVGEDRGRADERRLAEAGADRQRREREPARRVARLRLDGVGAAADGEVLAPQSGAVLRARHGARHLAFGGERPRVRLGQPRLRPEVGEQRVHRGERQRRSPRAAHSAIGSQRRVGRDPRAVRLDRGVLEGKRTPRDSQPAGAGEREARRGRRLRRARRRPQRDLAGPLRRVHVPARGRPAQRPSARAATGTSVLEKAAARRRRRSPRPARGRRSSRRPAARAAPRRPAARRSPSPRAARARGAGPRSARGRSPPTGRRPSA